MSQFAKFIKSIEFHVSYHKRKPTEIMCEFTDYRHICGCRAARLAFCTAPCPNYGLAAGYRHPTDIKCTDITRLDVNVPIRCLRCEQKERVVRQRPMIYEETYAPKKALVAVEATTKLWHVPEVKLTRFGETLADPWQRDRDQRNTHPVPGGEEWELVSCEISPGHAGGMDAVARFFKRLGVAKGKPLSPAGE